MRAEIEKYSGNRVRLWLESPAIDGSKFGRTQWLLLLMLITFFMACTPYPRYRSGGALPPESRSIAVQEEYGQDQMPLTTDGLLEFGRIIQSYLGTPYRGRAEKAEGIDCSEFTGEVFSRFDGTELPRTAAGQFEIGTEVARGKIRYGDLVYFSIDGNTISHVGIYIDFGEFIHSTKSSGIIISKLDDKYWKECFAGARRILP